MVKAGDVYSNIRLENPEREREKFWYQKLYKYQRLSPSHSCKYPRNIAALED